METNSVTESKQPPPPLVSSSSSPSSSSPSASSSFSPPTTTNLSSTHSFGFKSPSSTSLTQPTENRRLSSGNPGLCFGNSGKKNDSFGRKTGPFSLSSNSFASPVTNITGDTQAQFQRDFQRELELIRTNMQSKFDHFEQELQRFQSVPFFQVQRPTFAIDDTTPYAVIYRMIRSHAYCTRTDIEGFILQLFEPWDDLHTCVLDTLNQLVSNNQVGIQVNRDGVNTYYC